MTAGHSHPRTLRLRSIVYGSDRSPPDDPAELYHEASSRYAATGGRDQHGARLLQRSVAAQHTVARSLRRRDHLPARPLEPPALPQAPLGAILAARRSCRVFTGASLPAAAVSTLLHAAYGVTRQARGSNGQSLRAAPSAGAVYPLELFVVSVVPLAGPPSLEHYDPLRHALVRLEAPFDVRALAAALGHPVLVESCSAVVLVTAAFWRTRFKYGLRGYRFALLEAGHVTQNLLLCAEALELGAVALGGFYDRAVAGLLGLDGVDEAPLVAVCLGHVAREKP